MYLDTKLDIHTAAKQSAGAKVFQSNLEFNVYHEGSPGLNSPLAVLAKIICHVNYEIKQ